MMRPLVSGGICLCVLVAFIAGSFFCAPQLEPGRRFASVAQTAAKIADAQPPEATLAIGGSALGFQHAVADILFMQLIQSFGDLRLSRRDKYRRVRPLIHTASYLSPHLVPVYSFGALVLEDLGHVDEALLLLDQGIARNPAAFELWLYRDFSLRLFKTHQYAQAIAGIKRSMQLEGYPPQLERILAYAYEQNGQLDEALAQWKRILERSTTEQLRQIARRHISRLQARQE